MILVTNLPLDQSSFYAPHYAAYMDNETYEGAQSSNKPQKGWWKKELDKRRGRNRPRQQISIEQFVKESKNQGTRK